MAVSPLLGNPKPQYVDSTGAPLNAGTLTFYDAGTLNLAQTFTDSGGLTANDNPLSLNSRGEPESSGGSPVGVYGTDGHSYDVVLKDSVGVEIWTLSTITPVDDGLRSALASTATDNGTLGRNLVNYEPSSVATEVGVVNYPYNYGTLERYGGGAGESAGTNDTALANLVTSCNALGIPASLPGGTINTSALWHINLPISVIGNGTTISGGDADGVVWFGYRTGANQNVYFQNQFIQDIHVTSTTAGADGFTSSKTIKCRFTNLFADTCLGKGLVFGAAVACLFETPNANGCSETGVEVTYFTNSDGTTHVPSTANTFTNVRVIENGTAATDFGMLFALDPNFQQAAYGNTVLGGNIEGNEFTGLKVYGDNRIIGVWAESNGQDSGAADQYNYWLAGDDIVIDGGRCQGAGVKRKIFIESYCKRPKITNVVFAGTLQNDIEFDTTTYTSTHTGANNAAILTDSAAEWVVDAFIGFTITNSTDGSTATITDNTKTTITATLSGGTDNDWDTGDTYLIEPTVDDYILENNTYSGASTEITPTAYDSRNISIATKRRNTPKGTLEWAGVEFDLAANSSGAKQYYQLFSLDNTGESAIVDVTVFIDGTPPTLLGQVVARACTITGSNQYQRFTTSFDERFSATTTDSATADLPIIRITAAGIVQYQHNDGSSAQQVLCRYLKKL